MLTKCLVQYQPTKDDDNMSFPNALQIRNAFASMVENSLMDLMNNLIDNIHLNPRQKMKYYSLLNQSGKFDTEVTKESFNDTEKTMVSRIVLTNDTKERGDDLANFASLINILNKCNEKNIDLTNETYPDILKKSVQNRLLNNPNMHYINPAVSRRLI
ncbi:hypothetical protein [Rickettsiales endosymbiont of Stachyamoeba lipophora]|uniref:hypothetical protein n=1 Tax=Rickettsiales endosymbiont of Stachyamoeba lipophora TaxID=2486578 RepID=UPI000F647AF3|nr:hypothetical protein [Rickettsiales endosymbiont of Stachyamoeba lipophora]AZL16229.1 hypothetical protein EF513_06775 [Rickettsiales endosymbiont of Stachyamoeba lipophora]